MMEKQPSNNGRQKPPKNPKKDKKFGAKTLQISSDEANKLVGGIIEKGIFNEDNFFTTPPSTTPLPSLLPFPIARHRSHGPHWAPNVNHFGAGDIGVDDNDDHEEDDDPTNYDPIAVFAKPIERKKKKGLDLSNWREIVPKNVSSDIHEKQKYKVGEVVENRVSINVDNITPSLQGSSKSDDVASVSTSMDMEFDIVNESSLSKSNNVDISNDFDMEMEDRSSLDMLGQRHRHLSETFGPENTSLESQIDAENRTLLEKMTREEIVEAQEEIKNRINPQLLEILKKRGQKKLKKVGSSCSLGANDVPCLGVKEGDKRLIEDEKQSLAQESVLSSSMVTPSKLDSESRLDKSVESSSSKGSNLWDIWSKRVEDVRTLRFLFDGTVVEGNSLDQAYSEDSVAERDFLRTEGDPGSAGYTIKEALALSRSVVPGQRALALHLLSSVLTKALYNICDSRLDSLANVSREKNPVDWEAVWAYALGPEPELALSLRLALDDNHNSVVLASTKVIQCVLASDLNENFSNILEKMRIKDQYTAPVFRSRPDIRHGFLNGGFWKYSTKPSNILLPDEPMRDENEGERTIQDDTIVAGQDFAAGLVRMGLLPRLCYLLETEPSTTLEESILSILIAIARHSPTCASAIWSCERLVQTIVNRFTLKDAIEHQASKIKSVTLLRVLSQSSKGMCIEFIQKGFFQLMTLQLFRVTPSIDEWIKPGKEKCKLASELMIEQLRLWKVCVTYGYSISSFTSFFPALCLWLSPPTFEKLVESNLFYEFSSITMEVYLILEKLAKTLPNLHSNNDKNQEFREKFGDNFETWCWNDAGPMIDMALKWVEIMQNRVIDKFVNPNHVSSLLWVFSAVMEMLNTILVAQNGPNLPDFVVKVLLQFLKNGVLGVSSENKDGSFVEKLCHFRHQSDSEVSISSVCCLRGILQFIISSGKLIQVSKDNLEHKSLHKYELIRDNKILNGNIFKSSLNEWSKVMGVFMKSVTSEWKSVNSLEVFGRGGPAPGVGVGWGVSGGGFWSLTITLVQEDAKLLVELLRILYSLSSSDFAEIKEHNFMVESINSSLAMCLSAGPGDESIIQNVFDVLLGIPVLNFLDECIFDFLRSCEGIEPFKLDCKESDFTQFGKILASHFQNRWLSVKKKKNPKTKSGSSRNPKMGNPSHNLLDTIPEETETSVENGENANSLMIEWARQRLPLPIYWFLSPITTISEIKSSNTSKSTGIPNIQDPIEFYEVSKAGLFFLLGLEAMSSKFPDKINSPITNIPLIWKLHALSMPLLVGMGVLEEEKSRYVYEALQRLYTRHLHELWLKNMKDFSFKNENSSGLFGVGCLRFQDEINENYSTFIEHLVEQFAAISYGDVIFGRQIAIYLHRLVDVSVKLTTWNALSNAHVLELLPPLFDCLSQAEGYLEPIEEDESILEAYVKSWITGSLDRASTRNSMTYTMVLHHVSSFVFNNTSGEKQILRKKLVKSLLRDYSRKHEHEAMMLDFVQYNPQHLIQKAEQNTTNVVQMDYTSPRFEILKELCEGNSQLLKVVEKLKSSISNK